MLCFVRFFGLLLSASVSDELLKKDSFLVEKAEDTESVTLAHQVSVLARGVSIIRFPGAFVSQTVVWARIHVPYMI